MRFLSFWQRQPRQSSSPPTLPSTFRHVRNLPKMRPIRVPFLGTCVSEARERLETIGLDGKVRAHCYRYRSTQRASRTCCALTVCGRHRQVTV
jgi:hypothetical protein